ncbi:MAG: ATP-binding protein [Pirellulales bacterium]
MNQFSDNPLQNTWPPQQWGHRRVVIALSGGPDSTALATAIVELAPDRDRVAVAHFNHGWRGEESDSDERFASDLATSLGVRFFCDRTHHAKIDAAPMQHTRPDSNGSQFDFIAEDELPGCVTELNRVNNSPAL